MLVIPDRHLGRQQTDHADPDRLGPARLIQQQPVKQQIGPGQQPVAARAVPPTQHQIGTDRRKVGPAERLQQKVDAIVEFMVAQRNPVITQRVHRIDGRMGLVGPHATGIGDIIAHRVALQEIAIVKQQAVGRPPAQLVDQGAAVRQTDRRIGAVIVIVIGGDMHMQIGGFQNPQMGLTRLQQRRKGGVQSQGRLVLGVHRL